jgi:hypothetical protein
MLDAIQISIALWGMIVCGGIKAAQLALSLLEYQPTHCQLT